MNTRGTRRPFWDLLGGALGSRNLWLAIAAIELALTFLSQIPGDIRKPALNLAAGVASSAALLAVAWLSWVLVLRHMTGLYRVIVAAPLIVAAGIARGVVLQWLLVSWGISAPGPDGFRYRAMASVLVVVLGVTTGALLKVGVDGHRLRLEQLTAEQARLSLVLEEAETQVLDDQSGTLQLISSYLVDQLAAVRSTSPILALDSLESLASTVVRPLSHDLAAATPAWHPPEPDRSSYALDKARVWGSMTSIGSIDPFGPSAFVLIVTPASVAVAGLRTALILHLVAAALVFLGLWTLRAVAPQLGSSRPLVIRLIITSIALVLACTPAAVATLLLSGPVSGIVNALYIALVVPIVALAWSFIRATRMQRQEIDTAKAQIVEETRWWISRTRMAAWWQRTTTARALHGPVQSAIHAAVQRLQVAISNGTASDEVVESVLDDVRRSLPGIVMEGDSRGRLADELQLIESTWRPLTTVSVSVASDAAERLEQDIICREVCVDILGEATSNAVRHGAAQQVRASIELGAPNLVLIVVDDDGHGWDLASSADHAEHGLGRIQLETCALRWTGSRHLQFNRLTAELALI